MADKTIGDRLRELIEDIRKVSYYRLELDTGIDQWHIKKIAYNKVSNPQPSTMKRLARALNVEPGYFYVRQPSELSNSLINHSNPKTTEDVTSAIRNMRSQLDRLELDLKNEIKIPILGIIPASYPCLVEECYEGDITISKAFVEEIPHPEKLFAL